MFSTKTKRNLLGEISNYLPNFVIIKDVFNKKKTQNIKIKDMKNYDENLYKIDKIIKTQNTDLVNCEKVNEMYSLFQTQTLNVINRHGAYKKLSKKEVKLKIKPGITKGILQSIRKK